VRAPAHESSRVAVELEDERITIRGVVLTQIRENLVE